MRVGVLYQNGRGVPEDLAEAAKWGRLAAEQGDDWAQLRLGNAYKHGLEPVINFFQELSVQCKHVPAVRLGWQTNERVIRVM